MEKLPQKYLDYCIDIRRKLHMIPETGFDLPKTTSLILSELDKLGIKYDSGIGISSIVAVLEGKDRSISIGFRADIDALHIEEENDIPYQSTHPGKMHACGHDCHGAILLATLKYLVEEKVEFPYTIKAIFQAAEEGPISGGRLVCSDKLMSDVESFFAVHVSPDIPTGLIKTRVGEFNASCSDFRIELIGKSGHAAYPDKAIDPIQMATEVYFMIQTMKTRELSQSEKTVISVSGFHGGGESNNIIPEKCLLYGTVRTYNKHVKDIIGKKMEDIVKTVCTLHGGSYTFIYTDDCIPLINTASVTEFVMDIAKNKLGKNCLITDNVYSMGVDDFAYYVEKAQGVMYYLGVRNIEKNYTRSLHNCKFMVDETAFTNGIMMYLEIIKNYRRM